MDRYTDQFKNREFQFGDYCTVEYQVAGQIISIEYKVIAPVRGNVYIPVPVTWYSIEVVHDKIKDIVICIESDPVGKGEVKMFRECDISKIYKPKRTGIHDRHGIELYEGSVFKYTQHDGYMLLSFTGVVVWMKDYACFGYQYIDYPMRIEPFSNHHDIQQDFLDHIEVIKK